MLLELRQWTPIALTLVGVIAAMLLLLGLAFWNSWRQGSLAVNVAYFFMLSVLYLLVLVMLAWMYIGDYYGIKGAIPWLIGGILPIGVPWFGALGAVTISLQGVFDHNANWDPSYSHWHIARPLIGAVVGTIAFFIYLLLIKATGAQAPKVGTPVIDLVPFYVVAFLVGYREETFRSLIKAVTDMLLKPSGVQTTRGPMVAFEIEGARRQGSYDFGAYPANTPTTRTVTVYNAGDATISHAIAFVESLPATAPAVFARNGAGLRGDDLPTGGSGAVDITFTPNDPGRFSGVVKIVSDANVVGTLTLNGRGT
jgi:hypothetical protein